MSDADDHQRLLQILEANGQQFLNSFEQPRNPSGSKRKLDDSLGSSGEDEEWHGFGTGNTSSSEDSEDENLVNSFYECSEEELCHPGSMPAGGPSVITFEDPSKKLEVSASDKNLKKTFMSSKVSKLRQESSNPTKEVKPAEDDLDLSNRQNDTLLHKLIHTQLLSGVANADELNLTGAQRRKALEGRVLELAEKTKIGKGEPLVRKAEWNKAAKRVRLGIEAKQKARMKQKLEEMKDLGNYHPTLKRTYKDETESRPSRRDRGLKMGVGKFKGGVLKLSPSEIRSVAGALPSPRVKGRRR